MPFQVEAVALENIAQGDLVKQANVYIAKAARDVIERFKIAKPRVVTIKIEIAPDGDAEPGDPAFFPVIGFSIGTTIPGTTGKLTRAFYDADSRGLLVNIQDAENPGQSYIEGADEERPRRDNVTELGARR